MGGSTAILQKQGDKIARIEVFFRVRDYQNDLTDEDLINIWNSRGSANRGERIVLFFGFQCFGSRYEIVLGDAVNRGRGGQWIGNRLSKDN